MTNRTITLSYTNPVQMPHVTRVTEGGRQLTGDTAKNVEAVVTLILKNYHENRKNSADKTYYRNMQKSESLQVSLELDTAGTLTKIKLVYRGINKIFAIPKNKISEESSNALKTALVVQPNPVQSPKPRSPIPPLQPTQTSAKPNRSLSPRPVSTPAASSPNTTPTATSISVPMYVYLLVFAFFAAIGRGIRSLFASNQQPSSKSSAKDLTAIQPLRNGNNICFINAVFQALINTPKETKQALVNAHEKKIRHENSRLAILNRQIQTINQEAEQIRKSIQKLTKNDPWLAQFLSNSQHKPLYLQLEAKLNELPELIKERDKIQLSMNASLTLNKAIKIYNHESIWLNDLRGFDPSFGGSSQQDACQLLDKIFEPLNSELFPLFGEENQLIPYKLEGNVTVEEKTKLDAELKGRKDISPFPVNGLQKSVEPNPIVRIDIPKGPIALQALLDQKFTMRKGVAAGLFSFTENEQPGWYKVIEGRLVLETKNKEASEFIPLQLKRFKSDLFGNTSKVSTPIALPENNRVMLIINGQNETYEIQSLVMQEGSLSGGHYYSYVKKGNDWYEANDSIVTRLGQLPENANQAYMFFLRKV